MRMAVLAILQSVRWNQCAMYSAENLAPPATAQLTRRYPDLFQP
jgi:hypothetical protein